MAAERIASGLRILGRRPFGRPVMDVWTGGVVVVVISLAPWVLNAGSYDLTRWEAIFALVMAAVGLNIVTGFAGQLSLGPGAVFGVGAYAAAVLANHAPSHSPLALLCLVALVAAAAVGVIIGVPALRVGGFYLAMVTLYLALLLPQLVSHLSITGGQDGISLYSQLAFVPRLHGFVLYEVTAGVLVASVAFSALLLRSRAGRRFTAIRTSEVLAESLGIVPYRTKLLAFLLSSAPAGVGGAMYVYTQRLISPNSVDPTLSINLLAALVIGGMGRIWGPVIGGIFVLGLDELLGGFHQYELIVFGAILIVVVLRLPEGITGISPQHLLDAVRPRRRRRLITRQQWQLAESAHPAPPVLNSAGAATLRVRQARRAFGGVNAVDGVDLELVPGRIHGLIGPNGSGKTTLLNLVSGFYRLDAGTLTLGDSRIDGHSAAARARAGLGRTFQTPKLLDDVSLLGNVVAAADLEKQCSDVASALRLPPGLRAERAGRERALACLEYVGLAHAAFELAGEIPHPAQRLLEIARAIALNPTHVLLDEPAAGLGQPELEALQRVIRGLADAGVGILLVEHNMPFVLDVADEVTVLHQGRVLSRGAPREVAADPMVAQVYLGERSGGL